MEIGLISPPVGLNLYVINGIAPDISLKTILTGSMPFVACMVLAIVILLCFFPASRLGCLNYRDGSSDMSYFGGLFSTVFERRFAKAVSNRLDGRQRH